MDETKGLIGEDEEEEKPNIEGVCIENTASGRAAIYRDYTQMSETTKLKRLIRE
jgi:hypothetical protein